MINKLKSIYFYLLYKVNKLKSAKIVCLEMVRLLCSEIWVFAFVGWRYVPSPPVLSRVNNNVMLIICHTVQHKIDFYLWNFKSTIRRMCLFMFWCWACHKTESTDLPFEYEHVCHGVRDWTTVFWWRLDWFLVCLKLYTLKLKYTLLTGERNSL